MKKVLFVANKLYGGGAEKVLTLLANEMNKNNFNVEIVTYKKVNQTYNLNKDVKYTCIESKTKNRFIQKLLRIIKIRRKIKEYNPDLIIAFEYFVNMQTIIANMFLKNKLIISERADPNFTGNKVGIKQLRNILYRYANALVCQTPDAKAYFPKKVQDKAVIIPNPITPNLPERYTGERKKEIVNFCRIEHPKNLPLLIDAFEILNKEYSDYKLKIYGNGSAENEIREYVNQKHLQEKVEINDFAQNIHKEVIESAMFVSSSNHEGISNSMIEAMGIGLPTICTDCPCGGAKMMIENNVNGILVPVGDKEALYRAMKKIIENPEFAEEISKNAVKINERLKQDKICKMWMELM